MIQAKLLFLAAACLSGSAFADDCVRKLSQQDAAKAVRQFCADQPYAPKSTYDKYLVHFARSSFSCHYIYTEIMQPEVIHGQVSYFLNDRGEVVDVSTHDPLPMDALRCPTKMDLGLDFFSNKMREYRNSNWGKLIPSEIKGKTIRNLSRTQCIYVYRESSESTEPDRSASVFYFDFNGELMEFYPKKNQ